MPSCTSSAWDLKWISPLPRRTPRARESRSSTSPWAGKAQPRRRQWTDRSDRLARGPAGSSGSTPPATKPTHTGRARTTRMANILEWSPNGDKGNTFIWPNGEEICGFLKWDEWPSAVSDFDSASSSPGRDPCGPRPPRTRREAGLLRVTLRQPDEGPKHRRLLGRPWLSGDDLTTARSRQLESIARVPGRGREPRHPAASPAVLAVGAVCSQSRQLEFYSSQGPTIDGRIKPDIVGHDSVTGSPTGSRRLPVRLRRDLGIFARGRGSSGARQAGIPGTAPPRSRSTSCEVQRISAHSVSITRPERESSSLPYPPDVIDADSYCASGAPGGAGRTVRPRLTRRGRLGRLRVITQVKRNGHTIANVHRGVVPHFECDHRRTCGRRRQGTSGTDQHCVRAYDRAGNASPPSCAKIRLK